jgi:SAM-dependent methyltransferase
VHFLNQGIDQLDRHSCKACTSHELTLYAKANRANIFATADECDVIYYKCASCGSLNDFSPSSEYYDTKIDTAFANYYTDVGAGVEEIIDPITRVSKVYKDSEAVDSCFKFLEVGCGYGFGVHYATSLLGWKSTGIEPGGYGSIGKTALNIAIHSELLGQGSPVDQVQFNIIYASEVIEHTQDPLSFLQVAKDHLDEEGVLILTTPSAGFINAQAPASEAYASLFPGEHKIILTIEGAIKLLQRAGFAEVLVETRRPSNIVIQASKRKRLKQLYGDPELSVQATQESVRYLTLFGQDVAISKRLRLAMAARLIKVLTNSGQIEAALSQLHHVAPLLLNMLEPGISISSQGVAISGHTLSIPGEFFSGCLLSIAQERLLTIYANQEYPRRGLAFAKNLGFYACMILLNKKEPASVSELRHASQFLASFIEFALAIRYSPSTIYYIEFNSMLGPALTCLLLIRSRLGLPPSLVDFPFYQEQWFIDLYPHSHQDILGLLGDEPSPSNTNFTLNTLKGSMRWLRILIGKS